MMLNLDTYHVSLVIHILSIVAWMSGLLYLPRLFVYHVDAPNVEAASMLAVMEKRLLKIIMTPAIIIVWCSGLTLITQIGFQGNAWLHTKLLFVATLTIFHMFLARWRRQLANNHCRLSGKFFRIANEFPAVILVVIVILAILKPF